MRLIILILLTSYFAVSQTTSSGTAKINPVPPFQYVPSSGNASVDTSSGNTHLASQAYVLNHQNGSGVNFGNPTARVGLTVIPGIATSVMRSDASPPIDTSISPTWTGNHTFQSNVTVNGLFTGAQYGGDIHLKPTGDKSIDILDNTGTGTTGILFLQGYPAEVGLPGINGNAVEVLGGNGGATSGSEIGGDVRLSGGQGFDPSFSGGNLYLGYSTFEGEQGKIYFGNKRLIIPSNSGSYANSTLIVDSTKTVQSIPNVASGAVYISNGVSSPPSWSASPSITDISLTGNITGSSTIRGSHAFTTTAQNDTVTISGANINDFYHIQLKGTSAPLATDAFRLEKTSSGFILHRSASGTSGLQYDWFRIK